MLIICNGAIKSGSTWLFNILRLLTDAQAPPLAYLTNRTEKSPCLRPDRLKLFLDNEDFVSTNYISKNHLGAQEYRGLLASYNDVYVFDIERDPKDVVVSNYYHDCFRNGYKGTFTEYYWGVGRDVAASLSSYHDLWRDAGPRFYVSSYEDLHAAFAQEVHRIGAILGLSVTDEQIVNLQERTSLKSMRREYHDVAGYEGEKFFRKGEIGDWKNHFDEEMLTDIARIEKHGIRWYDGVQLRNLVKMCLRKWVVRHGPT